MGWKRRKSIAKLVDEILCFNYKLCAPITLIYDIMEKREINFKELDLNDDDFCGVYIVKSNGDKHIRVNKNLYQPRKNFTIAHELGHHFLGHELKNGTMICDEAKIFGSNKSEIEKEADHFAACFLMPETMIKQKCEEFNEIYNRQMTLIKNNQKEEQLQKYLCEFFKVSKEAMGYRLEQLKIIRGG